MLGWLSSHSIPEHKRNYLLALFDTNYFFPLMRKASVHQWDALRLAVNGLKLHVRADRQDVVATDVIGAIVRIAVRQTEVAADRPC